MLFIEVRVRNLHMHFVFPNLYEKRDHNRNEWHNAQDTIYTHSMNI